MPTVLDVQPVGYADAAHILGDVVAEQVRLAWVGVQAALDGTGGMAGSDDVGSSWGASYDAAARTATQATEDTCNACYQLAALLEQTAINYEGADAASVPGSSAHAAANRWAAATTSLGELQTAIGLGTPPPAGWSLLQHAIGYLWPNGHQDLLRCAAAAWERAAGQLSALVPEVGQAAGQVLLQRAPESDAAFTVVDAMTAHLTDLAASYRTLGAACTGYAGHLDQAHHAIISEVESFVEWTAGIEVAGGFFAVCTFGLSEAAAQAGEAAEISRAAAAIKSVIETLRALVTAARSAVDAATARIVVLADRVSAVLARRIEAAALKQADEIGILRPGAPLPSEIVPRTAATTPEGVAVDKLDAAADVATDLANIGDPADFQPSGLRGLEADELRDAIPSNWTRAQSARGGGEVYRDPTHRGRQIRIMPGYTEGTRADSITHGPYAVVSQSGVSVKIPLAGNPVLR